MCEYKIPLYHANDEKRVSEFVRTGKLITSRDTGEWAGTGMYFWDNISNAEYWLNQKKNKSHGIDNFLKCRANLSFEEMELLDLSDRGKLQELERGFELISKKMNKSIGVSRSSSSIGMSEKIDFIVDNLLTHIKIIKVIATYRSKPDNQAIFYKEKGYPAVDESAKVIYVVRESARLSGRKILQ